MNSADVADSISLTASHGTFNRGEIMSRRRRRQAISSARPDIHSLEAWMEGGAIREMLR